MTVLELELPNWSLFNLYDNEKPGIRLIILGPRMAVPPTRAGFPEFGPDPDFFDQTGPDLVRNLVRSPDFSKNCQTNA